MGEKFQTTYNLKENTRFAPQSSYILPGRGSTKMRKRIVDGDILNFWHFFFFCSCLEV